MVIKSNDRLAHITLNCEIIIIVILLKLLMLTTSALRDYVYLVCIGVTCRFQFVYSLISNCLFVIPNNPPSKLCLIIPAAVRKGYK